VDWPVIAVFLVLLVTLASSRWMGSRSSEAARWRLAWNVVAALAAVVLLGLACALFMD
jgi:hypothetical protein